MTDVEKDDSLPFTDEELISAFRIGSTEEDARRLVAEVRLGERSMDASLERDEGEERVDAPQGAARVSHTLDEDTLAILWLLGSPTREKVEAYFRARRRRGALSQAVDEAWRARLRYLRPWVEEQTGRKDLSEPP